MDPLCHCAKKVMFWRHSQFPPLSPVSRWVNLSKKHSDIRSKYYILNNVNMLKGTPFLSKLLKLESLPLETLKTFGHKIDYYFGRIPASLPKLSMHLISLLCFIIVFVKTMVFYLFCCLITSSFSRFLWPYCCDLSHPIKKLTAIAILPMRVVGGIMHV